MFEKHFGIYIIAFALTLFLTVIFEKKLIPRLTAFAKQPIYTDGPSWHLKKSGTPTMGGLAFLAASLISVLLISVMASPLLGRDGLLSLLLAFSYASLNALIGIIDDLKKLKRKENAGLSPRQKLILQLFSAVLFLLGRRLLLSDSTEIAFSFGTVNLGIFYYPIAIFVMLGIVNSANLTDGIDGLASSASFGIGVSLFYISASLNPETSIIASVIIGATVGFLVFNLHPAKIFMGDTGSLFLGAIITACAFNLGNPILLIFIAGVYVIEGVSVVLQVAAYKLTHKRIFKMAPIHHHLEKCGWSENKICIVAILLTLILSIPAYIFYLP